MNATNPSSPSPSPASSIPGPARTGGSVLSRMMNGSRKLLLMVCTGIVALAALILVAWWYWGDAGQPRVIRQYPSPNYRYECQVIYAAGSYWGGTQDRFTFSIHQHGNSLALNGTERTFTAAKMPMIEVMWLTNSDVKAVAGGTDQPVYLGRIEQDGSQSWRPDVAPDPGVPVPVVPPKPVVTPAPPTPAPAPVQLEKPAPVPAPATTPAPTNQPAPVSSTNAVPAS
ncbi:MAG: hypothetical protein ACAI35_06360 [Candidatus Methylacidiphilales bacterium]|nr:hypothetical protein [Candidatus Methylacidiphilales bacterium]